MFAPGSLPGLPACSAAARSLRCSLPLSARWRWSSVGRFLLGAACGLLKPRTFRLTRIYCRLTQSTCSQRLKARTLPAHRPRRRARAGRRLVVGSSPPRASGVSSGQLAFVFCIKGLTGSGLLAIMFSTPCDHKQSGKTQLRPNSASRLLFPGSSPLHQHHTMSNPLHHVKALLFDVFGTVVNWEGSIASQLEARVAADGIGASPSTQRVGGAECGVQNLGRWTCWFLRASGGRDTCGERESSLGAAAGGEADAE